MARFRCIFKTGGSATIAPVDLVEPDGIARLATAVSQRWGKLDILVINAAVLPELTAVADIDQGAFNKALTTNVLATQALIAHFDRSEEHTSELQSLMRNSSADFCL